MQRINLQQIHSFEQFYRIPKIFFTSEKYKDMRLESKTAYAILRDRFELSLKNGWVDEQQNVYFIFTVAALQELLGCGNKKVSAIKKDLANHGLLEEERQGMNQPNRMYLGSVTFDFEQKNTSEPLVQLEVSKRHVRKCQNDTSGNVKTTRPEVSKRHGNDTEYSDTELSDTEKKEKQDDDDDDVLTQSAESQKEKLLIDQYRKETGGSITQVKIQRLSELAKYHGPLIVSEAITKAALNDSSNLFYIEQVIDTLEQEKKQWQKTLSEQSTQSKEIAPKVPMFRFDNL
ncbi:hypothetical protein FEFB_06140 [Fructobacillus sp. EFB-N1]|uniref:replication initiator protein A n=1 Tax=Fructobacillus sp. EFB-N1 TaxID=1658766 RepID=UPI00065D93ED|nr:replication initiator protein A [Fructobacillus sp. EFB-N1]KMK53679.1 hypothetical protein FEFB_06140 [Fructobacillus sp. EFB-N1]